MTIDDVVEILARKICTTDGVDFGEQNGASEGGLKLRELLHVEKIFELKQKTITECRECGHIAEPDSKRTSSENMLIMRIARGKCSEEIAEHKKQKDCVSKKTGGERTCKWEFENFENLRDICNENFRSEKMDGYTCDKCHKKDNATNRYKVEGIHVGQLVVIQLKRNIPWYDEKLQSYRYKKLQHLVDLPEKFVHSFGNDSVKYHMKLISIIEHAGDERSGHYTAKCLCRGRQWYRFDDQKRTPEKICGPVPRTVPREYQHMRANEVYYKVVKVERLSGR